MSNGNVTSFTNNSTDPSIIYYGTITDSDTGEVFNVTDIGFNSSNFPTPNEAVAYTITTDADAEGNYTAFGVRPAPTVNKIVINSSSSANVTANANDEVTITGKGTTVTGSVVINGGRLIVDASAQLAPSTGTINISGGVMIVKGGGTVVNGGVVINSGGNLKVVKGGTVNGGVVINGGGRMIIGNAGGPGTINGAISAQRIRGFEITAGSTLTGK
jgi:uncharacterized protein with beta-barrel porin domain